MFQTKLNDIARHSFSALFNVKDLQQRQPRRHEEAENSIWYLTYRTLPYFSFIRKIRSTLLRMSMCDAYLCSFRLPTKTFWSILI